MRRGAVAPRSYRMGRRNESVEETRRRIVEATLALHAEHGILGTSWKAIAERADVAVATVYKHFPTLDELVPACGALLEARTSPPSPGDAVAAFAGLTGLADRVTRLVETFYDFYERGESYLEVDPRERSLPAVQEWEAQMRATREEFVREALRPTAASETTIRSVAALLDFPVYRSFRRGDVAREEAEVSVRRMLTCWLTGTGS
jgi:AcrR family transcriptional regulator